MTATSRIAWGPAAEVAIVLPTYNRPDALVCAVRSVLYQSLGAWRLLIIGDACDDRTERALAPFLGDERIRYVNLPWRCGEQALLNAAGMAVADGRFIALLNHDDLWLPAHLETALGTPRCEWFFGRAVWILGLQRDGAATRLEMSIAAIRRDLSGLFGRGVHYIEPASAWVVTRSLADRVGPWRPAAELFRTPIVDWALRAWRAEAKFHASPEITCLKFEDHWRADDGEHVYAAPGAAQQLLVGQLEDTATRPAVLRELRALAADPGNDDRGLHLELDITLRGRYRELGEFLMSDRFADYYKETGFDSYGWLCSEIGAERGWRWRRALERRTGETLTRQPGLEEVTEHLVRELRE